MYTVEHFKVMPDCVSCFAVYYIAIPILNITIWIKKKYSSDLKSSTAYKESYMHLRISTELKGLIVSQHFTEPRS